MQDASIHIWVPGIREGAGGIQAFSRVYVQTVREAFPWALIRVFVKNDEPEADDPLRRMGVRFYSVAGHPPWLRSFMLLLWGLGYGLLDRPRCVVTTHLHFLPALLLLRWLRGVRVMSVLHGIEAWNLRSGLRVWAMRRADHLMAVSHHTREVVIGSYGLAAERVSVVPNTFDTERFQTGPKPEALLQRYGLSPEQPVLLTVSRLAITERYKGHRQVLAALGEVRKSHPDVRYLVVGTGDDLPRLQEAVRARGLEQQVILAGHVPGHELPDHYRLCDAFVMPSSKEGFGIVFLEAMACGKPVVAGNADGSVDALDGGRLGILVDPHDPAEIAQGIRQALRREPEEALWGDPERLRAAVVAQFGYPRVSRLLAEDLAPLLGMNSREVSALLPPRNRQRKVRQIVVVTQLTSPYQVEFFNALSLAPGIHLEVIYLTSEDRGRQWKLPGIAHTHLILSRTPHLRKDAMLAVRRADLAVFNFYTDWFTLAAIRERAASGSPWVFWGERPGFLQTGRAGIALRWLLLRPLHRQPVPIWGVGRFGVEGYRREFGEKRDYQNMPYFSDLQRFMAVESPPEAQRVFFYSGSFTQRKGVDLLAQAFARLASLHPQVRLVLAGSGPLEPEMRRILHDHAEKVTWLGFRQWEELPECYARGGIFCFPSRYDGWGLALVEAMASGMPAISTRRTGAAVEFLEEPGAGWLVPDGDVPALTAAMEAALLLPGAELDAMGRCARQRVAGDTLDSGVERFSRAAEKVIKEWAGGGQPQPERSEPCAA